LDVELFEATAYTKRKQSLLNYICWELKALRAI